MNDNKAQTDKHLESVIKELVSTDYCLFSHNSHDRVHDRQDRHYNIWRFVCGICYHYQQH
jgi:hypothetical protein